MADIHLSTAGNGGNLAYHLGATAWLPEQGYQVLMFDYRGYGLSAGSPTLPAGVWPIQCQIGSYVHSA